MCVVQQNCPHAVACWAAAKTHQYVRRGSKLIGKHSPNVSILCCIINICGDDHNSSVDIVHHVCPCRSRDIVQQQGIQLGYPTPIVDCNGGVGVVSHQLRRCDDHLQQASEV